MSLIVCLELTKEIPLEPKYFDANCRQTLIDRLLSEVEGSCPSRYGYIIAVTSITHIGAGRIDETFGHAVYALKYQAIVYRPIKGEVVDAVVRSVNKLGVSADVGPLQIFVSHHHLPRDMKFEPENTPPCYISEDQSTKISADDEIRVRIISVQKDAPHITAVASMTGDYLGVISGTRPHSNRGAPRGRGSRARGGRGSGGFRGSSDRLDGDAPRQRNERTNDAGRERGRGSRGRGSSQRGGRAEPRQQHHHEEHTEHRSNSKQKSTNQSEDRLGEATKLFADTHGPKDSPLPVAFVATLKANKKFLPGERTVRKHLHEISFTPEKHDNLFRGSKYFEYSLKLRFDRYRGYFVVTDVSGPCFLVPSITDERLSSLRNHNLELGTRINQGYAIAIDPTNAKSKLTKPIFISLSFKRDALKEADKEYLGDWTKTKEQVDQKKRKRADRDTVKVSKKHKRTTQFDTYETPDPFSKTYDSHDYYLNVVRVANKEWDADNDEDKLRAFQERIFYNDDEKVVIVHPPVAFSVNHLAIVPRDMSLLSGGIEALTDEHLELVRHVESVATDLIAHLSSQDEDWAKANPFLHEFRVGVIGLWFQKGLIFQVMSIDFEGDVMMKKTYWNTFMTKIFLTTRQIKKQLKQDKKMELNAKNLLQLRKCRSYQCPKCGTYTMEKKFKQFFIHYQACGVDGELVRILMEGGQISAQPEEGYVPPDASETLQATMQIPERAIVSGVPETMEQDEDSDEEDNVAFTSTTKISVNVHSKFNPFGR